MKIVMLLFLYLTAIAAAQTTPDTTQSQTDAKPDTAATHPNITHDDTRMFIDKIEIKGELEKPQAVFFIPSQTPEIDDIKIQRSFFNDIFRPIDKQSVVETKYTPPETQLRRDVIDW